MLTYRLELGHEGVDSDQTNPLSRATRRLLQEGQPNHKFSLCFLDANFNEQGKPDLRWLGVFVHSGGDRVLFFPGYRDMEREFTSLKRGEKPSIETFPIDHITLDKGFSNVHVTDRQSNSCSRAGTPKQLENGVYLWFAMTIRSFNVMRPIAQTTEIRADVPSSDASRRSDVLQKEFAGQDTPLVTVHPISPERFPIGFPHFAFVIGEKGFPALNLKHIKGQEIAIPFGQHFVKDLQSNIKKFPIRTHRLSLSEKFDIDVIVCWLPGTIEEKSIWFIYPA